MCFFTCTTAGCIGDSYNQCTNCANSQQPINGVCYCVNYFDSACSQNAAINFYSIFQFLSTFYTALVVAIFILYTLNVRLKFTYRIFSVLQLFSYAIHFQTFYYGQTEYFLRFLYNANGGFFLDYRNQNLVINYATPSVICLCLITVWYFASYSLVNRFIEVQVDYWTYLKKNLYRLFKQAIFLITIVVYNSMKTQNMSMILIPAILQLIIVLSFLVLTIYKHQKGTLKSPTYPYTFYIYSIFCNLSVVVIPILSLNYLVYVVPFGFYIIIMVIGRHQKMTKQITLLYVQELLLYVLPLTFSLVDYTLKSYIGLFSLLILILLCYVDMTLLYISQPNEIVNAQNILSNQQNTISQLQADKAKSNEQQPRSRD